MRILVLLLALLMTTSQVMAKEALFRIEPETQKALHPEDTACANILTFVDRDKYLKICRYGLENNKALGSYVPKPEMTFKSGYKDVNNGSKAMWAYKLGMWYEKNGGGYGKTKAEVPYSELEKFAKEYWGKNEEFKKAMLPPKDWFLHEAIVDGMTIWMYSKQASEYQGDKADGFIKSYLGKLKNRKP